jgi:hypothetical protein
VESLERALKVTFELPAPTDDRVKPPASCHDRAGAFLDRARSALLNLLQRTD